MRIEGIKKMLCTSVIFVIFTGALFADDGNSFFSIFAGKKIDMQMIYDNMSELVPIVGYMRPEYTTDIDLEFATAVDSEIKNQMIMTSTFKPVSMVKWLTSKYGQNKASSIFDFIKELNEERYPVNVMGIYKPYIYKVGNEIVIKISVFPFSKGGYPISAVRIVKSEKEMKEAIPYLLSDLSKLLKVQNEQFAKLAVEPFKINCRTLIEQRTGEFDFITTSFSNQEGVEIKSTDDYFSELFSYQAQCTGLFAATTTKNIDEYISKDTLWNTAYSGYADYVVRGDITLSNRFNILTLQLINARTGQLVRSTKHITKSFTLEDIWNYNYMFISDFCKVLFNQQDVKFIENIDNEGKYFYMNGMFAGFDSIENVPIRAGRTIINTGTKFASDVSINPNLVNEKNNKDYYIYTNNDKVFIYKGREGAYVWNFIRKIAILVCLCLCVFSCKTVIPVALLEVTPLPREVMIQEDSEYEPVFSVMKILEISEVNGVQKYVIAKVEADGKDIENSAMGEIAADLSFENPLGIIKVISRMGDFLRCSIESSTHKIPNNSYIRIQIGEKEKEKEDSDTKKDK